MSDRESAVMFGNIIRHNKTMTALDLSRNKFGRRTGAGQCIADGLGNNSTLLKIDLSTCALSDDDLSSSRNTTLQKMNLERS